ncbi:MAG: transporter [Rhodothermales bacterium]|nr:transporter [Rhodothermales bacterium]
MARANIGRARLPGRPAKVSIRLRNFLTLLGATSFVGLTTISYAEAHFSTGIDSGAAQMAAQMPMDDMGKMQMNSMMRPDMAPPQGVIGGMSPEQGAIMPILQYMHMSMDGNRDGTEKVSTAEVLAQFPIAPLSMDVDMLMAGVMYGVTDDFSAMAMIPYLWKSMDHVTGAGVGFTTRSEGFGDLRIIGGNDVYKTAQNKVTLSAGLSLPTGSTDKRDDTPAGPNQLLPYPMQIGSGTFDLLPGITYAGRSAALSWGGQVNSIVRLGENSDDYALGNVYTASVWSARRWADWVSSSIRLTGEIVENTDGADPRLNPMMVPTADPDLRGGTFLSAGLGLNFMVPSGPAAGARLSVEGIVPLVQDLDGPQVERDYAVLVGLRKSF